MSLTRYKEGSARELAQIALPLIVSTMSGMMMIFVDRLLLAQFSTSAMNAATNAATMGWSFIMFIVALCGIAEAFVAQNNGAGHYRFVGRSVWQMMWMAIFSFIVFFPLSLFAGQILFIDSPYYAMEMDYFSIMTLMGPIAGMNAALTAFWVGRGKAFLITGLSILANILNFVLDYALIFGVSGWVDSMGIKGAAIATFLGELFLAVVLFCLMLGKRYREKYATGDCSLHGETFIRCIKIGLPSALFVFLEIAGWGVFYRQMTRISHEHITIAAVAQSLVILLWGLGEGLNKAMVTIAGNRIGEGRTEFVMKSLRMSGIFIIAWHLLGLAFLFFHLDTVWGWFVDIDQFFDPVEARSMLRIVIVLTVIYSLFETFRFAIAGVLTAAGDTLFLMIAGVAMMWGLLILPVELFVVFPESPVTWAFAVWVIFAFIGCLINWSRLLQGAWSEKELVCPEIRHHH